VYTKGQFRAYGRSVRERFDDFCWENDRIAHRMYAKALETYSRELLVSSTVAVVGIPTRIDALFSKAIKPSLLS